jgi:hypothetical protein
MSAIHPLYYDVSIPDATISLLLKAVGLPASPAREIKRLRLRAPAPRVSRLPIASRCRWSVRTSCGRCRRTSPAGKASKVSRGSWASIRKTAKAWRRRGGWRPRILGRRRRAVEAFASFIEQRAPEIGWNNVVLHRELQGLGFTAGYLQVRSLQPPPDGAALGDGGHDPVREGARRAGPSRLRPVPALGGRRRGHGTPLRLHPWLFPMALGPSVPARATGRRARRPRAPSATLAACR